jgi:solute carrier family 8 (sodium/calcium exchanger)
LYRTFQFQKGKKAKFCLLSGSSAPEILLAIVGVVGNGFEAEALGPGTIVGSAAFNLLGISAVCIAGIPKGETRRYAKCQTLGPSAFVSEGTYRGGRGDIAEMIFLDFENIGYMRVRVRSL